MYAGMRKVGPDASKMNDAAILEFDADAHFRLFTCEWAFVYNKVSSEFL